MIRHIVLFRVHDGLNADDPRVTAAYDALAVLGKHIDALRSWRVARNLKSGSTSCDFALIAEVDDLAALARYLEHPEHQAVVRLLKEACTWISVDLPTDLAIAPPAHG